MHSKKYIDQSKEKKPKLFGLGHDRIGHQAMRFHNREQVELYIELGADMEIQSTNNGGALHGYCF